MSTYCTEVRKMESKFMGLELHHVVRDKNVAADILAKLGSTQAEVPAGIFVQVLKAPTVKEEGEEDTPPSSAPPSHQYYSSLKTGEQT